ncbi:MAG: CehA/McbA family metallohydrolase [Christensenellales bacterium]
MKDWLCVELHCHSVESDGDMTYKQLVDRAIERGYKAIALTDHNTVAGIRNTVEYGAARGLCVIAGIEWTTFWGHIVVTGGGSNLDWRTITPDNIDECIAYAQSTGDMVTLAHPHRPGWPLCSCCHNDFSISDWNDVDAIEVWSHFNPHKDHASIQAISQWHDLLCQGYRIAAVYGYDWHEPDFQPPVYAHTYVGCDRADCRSVIEAVKSGRTYVSLGLRLDLTFTVDGVSYCVGENAPCGKGVVRLDVIRDENYLYCGQVTVDSVNVIGDGWSRNFDCRTESGQWNIDAKGKFLRVEVNGSVSGERGLIAITSPIWLK